MGDYTVHQAKQNLFFAPTGFSFSAFAKFKKLASEVDIIHYHYPNPFADLLHLVCRPQKASLVTYHSDIIKQKFLYLIHKPVEMWFLRSVDRIVTTSPNYFASSSTLQKYSEKVTIIPIGVDAKKFANPDAKRLKNWRKIMGGPFFLFVGVMRYYKGLHLVLDAISGSDFNFAIAGINGMQNELRQKAKKWG